MVLSRKYAVTNKIALNQSGRLSLTSTELNYLVDTEVEVEVEVEVESLSDAATATTVTAAAAPTATAVVPVAEVEAALALPASSAANAVDALRAIRIASAVFFIINPCISYFKTSMFGLFITYQLPF
ncbi:hypothetical protein VSA01S_21780 [Vibrio sagamiensis NBRC 104589]|uniref:Uncharacterized protein n=1 Tax=Vibrio sagamiensis NBRC 104589 TaxID=1219064 RepID=A0A511QFZ6_9VIBR|nr:hypothetical protein VSA01S_21780 [Vibrio sagamiensis NBRC 104589]